jgi:hypothetical protein
MLATAQHVVPAVALEVAPIASKGRGLVANEFIPAGTMVLQESALAFTRITHADMEVCSAV